MFAPPITRALSQSIRGQAPTRQTSGTNDLSLMVERAFHDGDSSSFEKYVSEYDIQLWSNRFVFDMIARDYVHKTSDRPEAHYELVRDLLQFSIEHSTVDWNDDDVLHEWIQ